jgi:hypothetical protein
MDHLQYLFAGKDKETLQTSLHDAIFLKDIDGVKRALEKGADPLWPGWEDHVIDVRRYNFFLVYNENIVHQNPWHSVQ